MERNAFPGIRGPGHLHSCEFFLCWGSFWIGLGILDTFHFLHEFVYPIVDEAFDVCLLLDGFAHLHAFVYHADDLDFLHEFACVVFSGSAHLQRFSYPVSNGVVRLCGLVCSASNTDFPAPQDCVHPNFEALPLPSGPPRCSVTASHLLHGGMPLLAVSELRVFAYYLLQASMPGGGFVAPFYPGISVSGFDSLLLLKSVDLVSLIFQIVQHMSLFLLYQFLGRTCFALGVQFSQSWTDHNGNSGFSCLSDPDENSGLL